jgi:hypothetical protein
MPEFTLDQGAQTKRFADLDQFTRGYIEAAFWLLLDVDGNPDAASLDDLSGEAWQQLLADCIEFNHAAGVWLDKACLRGGMSYDMERAGTDFWLTRNRHGAGYWDRGLGIAGSKLTEFAHSFGGCDLYRGDDGLIYSA